jgi:cytochrome bd-type quinol oxidase subunit 2
MRPRLANLRDTAWYVIIGLSTVLVIALWAIYMPENKIPSKWMKWEPFAFITTGMLIFVVRSFRHRQKTLSFWGVLAILFGIHVLSFVLLYPFFVELGSQLILVAIFPIEVELIVFILGRVFRLESERPDL